MASKSQLAVSLNEIACVGVEEFSVRRDEVDKELTEDSVDVSQSTNVGYRVQIL